MARGLGRHFCQSPIIMIKEKQTSQVSLQGTVAQVVEEQGQTVTKIFVQPFYLSVRDGLALHLGDTVEVHGSISINDVKQEFQSKDHDGT